MVHRLAKGIARIRLAIEILQKKKIKVNRVDSQLDKTISRWIIIIIIS